MSHTDLISSGINVSSLTFSFPYWGEKPWSSIPHIPSNQPWQGTVYDNDISSTQRVGLHNPPIDGMSSRNPLVNQTLWPNVGHSPESWDLLTPLLSQTHGQSLTESSIPWIFYSLYKATISTKSHDYMYLQIQRNASLFVFLWLYIWIFSFWTKRFVKYIHIQDKWHSVIGSHISEL